MQTLVLIIHVILAIFLVALVLIQQGKGADAGASFGSGASQTVFGGRGSTGFLVRLTAIVVFILLATSVTLSILNKHKYEEMHKANIKVPSSALPQLPSDGLPQLPSNSAQKPFSSIPQMPGTDAPALGPAMPSTGMGGIGGTGNMGGMGEGAGGIGGATGIPEIDKILPETGMNPGIGN